MSKRRRLLDAQSSASSDGQARSPQPGELFYRVSFMLPMTTLSPAAKINSGRVAVPGPSLGEGTISGSRRSKESFAGYLVFSYQRRDAERREP